MHRFASPPRLRPALIWGLFLLLLAPVTLRILRTAPRYVSPPRGDMIYNDMKIFLGQVKIWAKTGQLYRLDQTDFYNPGSGVYKYPPTLAAIIKPLAEMRWRRAMRILLPANFIVLGLTLALLIAAFRPGLVRGLLMLLVFLSWQPFWESLAGMQLEPTMLLLLTLAMLASIGRRDFLAGIPVGLCGALKVYPIALVAYFALRRRWSAVAGALAGAGAALVFASLVLSPALTGEYLLRILPRLGGTSLMAENVSLLGNLGRTLRGLMRVPEPVDPPGLVAYALLDSEALRPVRPVAFAVFAPIALLLLVLTVRVVRRAAREARPAFDSGAGRAAGRPWGERFGRKRIRASLEPHAFGVAICLLLFLLPTSWPDYQTMLALPMLSAIALAPAPREDPVLWALLGLAVLSGAVSVNHPFFSAHPAAVSWVRAWLPLVLWAGALRRMRWSSGTNFGLLPSRVALHSQESQPEFSDG